MMNDRLENYSKNEIITTIRAGDKSRMAEKSLLKALQIQRCIGVAGLVGLMELLNEDNEEEDNDD